MEKTIINCMELKRRLEAEGKAENVLISNEKLIALDGRQVEFVNCTFQDCELVTCNFEKATFVHCSFYGCDLKQVSLAQASFTDCTLVTRMVMCNLSQTSFSGGRIKNGYMRHTQIDLTSFDNLVFDGVRSLNPIVITAPVFQSCRYTMGGARSDEVETAENNFFKSFA